MWRDLLEKIRYPTSSQLKKVFAGLLVLNMIPMGWQIKSSDSTAKYKLSLTRKASFLYGKLFRKEIRESWRSPIFSSFNSLFKVNVEENKRELSSYRTLDEYFTRELREDCREVAQQDLVCPCDGRILSSGEVSSNFLDSIKGRNYSFTKLLTNEKSINFEDYRDSLKKHKDYVLRYLTIYLAPGDCHRYVSPANWNIISRRHMMGYLLGVFDLNLWRKGDVFSINERVAYFGNYSHGALHMILVGAYNVGSIEVFCDSELATNKQQFQKDEGKNNEIVLKASIVKGEQFGMFHAGSTIVLIAEMPSDVDWTVNPGQYVKFGERLI